ncbi:hypothetical protein [Nonomuraea rubra]|uniref:Uncharacterized protein n=1 Tax=Nonomuraea rubra TaxID=46180 RepID=A0A7X0U5E8_9ACTN|nr:hypothetical protein [Nonomuraea rubra]MBB6555947.1 hypothetical protein [Nonomuraea rubra]
MRACPGVLAPGRLCGVLALARLYAGERWHRARRGNGREGLRGAGAETRVRGRPDLLVRLGAAPGRERVGLRRLPPRPGPVTRLATTLRRLLVEPGLVQGLRGLPVLRPVGGLPRLPRLPRLAGLGVLGLMRGLRGLAGLRPLR